MSKRPSFQFYPSDWRTEQGLRLCSMGARGLWIEMMCLMHDGQPYGHLTIDAEAISIADLARLVGEPVPAVKRWVSELRAKKVFSETDDGLIYSRRMVRDEDVRDRRAAGGSNGGEHGAKGASHGSKGGRPKTAKTPVDDAERGQTKPPSEPPLAPPIKPPPSSSSPSPSSETVVDGGARARGASPDQPWPDELIRLTAEIARAAGLRHQEPGTIIRHQEIVKGWLDEGFDPEEHLRPGVKAGLASAARDGTAINSLQFFDRHIRQTRARKEAGIDGTDPRHNRRRSRADEIDDAADRLGFSGRA